MWFTKNLGKGVQAVQGSVVSGEAQARLGVCWLQEAHSGSSPEAPSRQTQNQALPLRERIDVARLTHDLPLIWVLPFGGGWTEGSVDLPLRSQKKRKKIWGRGKQLLLDSIHSPTQHLSRPLLTCWEIKKWGTAYQNLEKDTYTNTYKTTVDNVC